MEEQFKTRDIGLASFLIVSGVSLRGTERDKNSGQVYFLFNNQEKCTAYQEQYQFKKAEINARKFWETSKELKAIVFGGKKYENKT